MDKAGEKVRNEVKEKPFLPDEVITNILIWLPVKSLVRFELVCRKWRDIILARDFVDLHHRSSSPVILVGKTDSFEDYYLDLFAIDKWWDLSTIHRFPCAAEFRNSRLKLISDAGLIVLESNYSDPKFVVILNPARPSHEFVKINYSDLLMVDIFAVYYHPSLKEYCSLWRIVEYCSNETKPVLHKLVISSSKPSLTKICNPFDYNFAEYECPLFINHQLYWTLKFEQPGKFGGRNDILEFDILSDEFKVIPCPIPLNTECEWHQTHLLNSGGVLSFVLILPSTITIWRLEDGVHELWTSIKYTISLESYQHYSLSLLAIVEGNLAFTYRGRLLVFNLLEGTVMMYPKRYAGDLLSHQITLASLKNFKSELYIDKDVNLVV